MKIIALIVLICNVVLTLRLVRDVFDSEKNKQISSFVASLITIAHCTLSIYCLWL